MNASTTSHPGAGAGDAVAASIRAGCDLVRRLEQQGWQPADLVWVAGRSPANHETLTRLLVLAEAESSAPLDRWAPPRWRAQLLQLADDARRGGHAGPAATPRGPHATTAGTTPETASGPASPTWSTALSDVLHTDVDARRRFVAAAELLQSLGPIPILEPVPASWPTQPPHSNSSTHSAGRSDHTDHPGRPNNAPADAPAGASSSARRFAVDTTVLERVRALLAKAESTAFEAEAQAFTAKAQELIARHAIDTALLDAQRSRRSGTTTDDSGSPAVGRRLHIGNPYQRPKMSLLSAVARPNRCRAVADRDHSFVTIFGHPSDLDAVELLFTSLLVQATNAMLAAGSRVDAAGRSRTRSFRTSFLTAFAQRVAERLTAANDQATREATESGRHDVLPVLASRSALADAALRDAYPRTSKLQTSVTNSQGWREGRSAAERASLGASGAIPGDRSRRALPR